ncbi:MAG: hypothetical protein ABI068_04700 [Ktedonobacterales bacterium]
MERDTSANALLTTLRAGGGQMRQAQEMIGFDSTLLATEQSRRAEQRAQLVATLAADIRPTDRPLARWLLTQEVAAHQAQDQDAGETLYTLVALLARFGQPEDALLIWQARQANSQTQVGVDVEQMARAGVDHVRAYLIHLIQQTQQGDSAQREPAAQAVEDAREALAWLDEGAALGAFDDLPGYFAWADERFGLYTSGPT